MTLSEIRDQAITPALALLPPAMGSKAAVVSLLANGLQESRFTHRRQIGGPARGFWQFEKGGGVRGVLRHTATAGHARVLCEARGVPATEDAVYAALEHDDVLAAGFARLLLWSDPRPLPALGEVAAAWDLYIRTWRPGKPHRRTWAALYAQALEEVAT
ncbi:hypothetical protein VUJ49_09135 [Pseudomonas berkeleyensis]|uniref:Uncharacterized protein n=1 Tax=Pseudomonas berkeleyensis TaxID=2726956 RepID=A0A7G5DTX3_9PSED|nr:hypothetical protein [Pseudomonas berkeleyensis]QMV65198.1 hypothetical protein HS968_09100 [Pseudomonas berkeleyensis]WSO40673.1 hypothetical protein VUJ49_09135 [Pseudomonas berkeleyensis]